MQKQKNSKNVDQIFYNKEKRFKEIKKERKKERKRGRKKNE